MKTLKLQKKLAIAIVAASLTSSVLADTTEVRVVQLKPGTVPSNPRVELYDTVADALELTAQTVATREELLTSLASIHRGCIEAQDRGCLADVYSQTISLNENSLKALNAVAQSYEKAEQLLNNMVSDTEAEISEDRNGLISRLNAMSQMSVQLKEAIDLAESKQIQPGEEFEVASLRNSFQTDLELLFMDAQGYGAMKNDLSSLKSQHEYIRVIGGKTEYESGLLANETKLVDKALELLIKQAGSVPIERLFNETALPSVATARASMGWSPRDVVMFGTSQKAGDLPPIAVVTNDGDFDPQSMLNAVAELIDEGN